MGLSVRCLPRAEWARALALLREQSGIFDRWGMVCWYLVGEVGVFRKMFFFRRDFFATRLEI